ncbi:MAG: Fur family transcriptional regulator [Pseudomonadota bacterium]
MTDRICARPDTGAAGPGPGGSAIEERGPVGFSRHDHTSCVSTALREAESRCAEAGLRLTPARRRVLEILLEEHRALGAYDILDRLRDEGLGAQPPAAYRALDFLVTHGFAHRIEGLNAFVACVHPGEAHVPAFLHCRACGAVAEASVPTQSGLLARAAKETGFYIETTVIEAKGLCTGCQGPASSGGTGPQAGRTG